MAGRKAGQFQATLTWNTIVAAVRKDLPVRRHRRGLRVLENCFAGDSAVSWLVDYLDRNKHVLFSRSTCETLITREKATLLLRKFAEQHIIENVRESGGPFEDSPACFFTFSKENCDPTASIKAPAPTVPTLKDRRAHKPSRGRESYQLPAVSLKSASSLVKSALFNVSPQRRAFKTISRAT